MAAVAKPSNTMHIILLVLLGATLVGVLFLVYVAMGDDGRYERMVGMINDQKALINDQKTMISRVESSVAEEPEEIAVTQPTGSAISDVVIYEDTGQGLRFVTAPGCEGIFEVKKMSQPSGERFTAVDQYSMYIPGAKNWPQGVAMKNFVIMTPAEYGRISLLLEKEKDLDSSLNIGWIVSAPRFYLSSGNYLIEVPTQDGPSSLDLAAKQGGVCSFVTHPIPAVSPQ